MEIVNNVLKTTSSATDIASLALSTHNTTQITTDAIVTQDSSPTNMESVLENVEPMNKSINHLKDAPVLRV